jgi:hypothetical protein
MYSPLPKKRNSKRFAFLILLIPFIVLIWPAFYNMDQPDLVGMPFFYWFQFLWIALTALLTAIVYMLES